VSELAVDYATDYDVVIIGGGIHGIGVAQDAVASGYRVLVLEQYPLLAQGTSSKSSKLIHGGLRYLESGQFHLVYECLRERAILLRNAPHLVELVPFHIPVYATTQRRPWKIRLGMIIYSLFSGKRFYHINNKYWNKLDGLITEKLDAVFSYYDAQTDDARLTRSVAASAAELGAELITSATFEQAAVAENRVAVSYSVGGERKTVTASVLVNAAGAWVNSVLQKIVDRSGQQMKPMPVELVQGAHIVIEGQLSHPYYLESPQDGRAVFVVPWKDGIMVGTTEKHFQGDPARVEPTADEIAYLLEIYNHHFNKSLNPGDIQQAFAGLRVLPAGSAKASNKSRDTHLLLDDKASPRLVSIFGGKLTSYRSTSEKVLRLVRKSLPKRKPVAITRNLELPVVD
jgi:glycerol-3-phosphate dehydrogenase